MKLEEQLRFALDRLAAARPATGPYVSDADQLDGILRMVAAGTWIEREPDLWGQLDRFATRMVNDALTDWDQSNEIHIVKFSTSLLVLAAVAGARGAES